MVVTDCDVVVEVVPAVEVVVEIVLVVMELVVEVVGEIVVVVRSVQTLHPLFTHVVERVVPSAHFVTPPEHTTPPWPEQQPVQSAKRSREENADTHNAKTNGMKTFTLVPPK